MIGIALLICALLFVFGVVLIRVRKVKKMDLKTIQYVDDDTDELPDLSRYDLQDSRFIVEEDITFVHTNKNGIDP